MKVVRSAVFGLAALLLGVGYAASQYAYFGGDPRDYASRVDSAPVIALSGLLFALCIVFPFVRSKKESD